MSLIDNNLESKITFETDSAAAISESPFRILFLGNWSGRKDSSALTRLRPIEIDRDNFDQILSKLDVKLELDISNNSGDLTSLHFLTIDDFHPDHLFHQIPLFADLRDLRRRLLDPEAYDQAAHEIRSQQQVIFEKVQTDEPQNVSVREIPDGSINLLDEILSQSSKPSVISDLNQPKIDSLSNLLTDLVSPHTVKIDENEQSLLLQTVDSAISDLMRRILHHAEFQRLEAAWRGLQFLIRRVETDIDLKIYILDITKNQLVADLKAAEKLADSTVFQTIVTDDNEYYKPEPWSAIFGDYSFDLNINDIAALIRLAKISSAADAPFVSYMASQVFGIGNDDARTETFSLELVENKLWTTLRYLPESSYLGFGVSRFLMRLPYGVDTEPVESFSFEEFIGKPDREQYLWANPSFICALLLARSYRLEGENTSPLAVYEVEELPVHIYALNGNTFVQSCVESTMNRENCEKFLDFGLMPLLSDGAGLRLSRWQSVSETKK